MTDINTQMLSHNKLHIVLSDVVSVFQQIVTIAFYFFATNIIFMIFYICHLLMEKSLQNRIRYLSQQKPYTCICRCICKR